VAPFGSFGREHRQSRYTLLVGVASEPLSGYNAEVKAALALALGVVFTATAGAAPKPRVERARAGNLEAVFSYAYDAARFRFTKQRLTIRREGALRFAARLRRPPEGGLNAQPAGYFSHRRSISISDLDGDSEPEVILDLYWGGAHCCWYTQIYRYVPEIARYRTNVHVWGNFSYVLADLDHNGQQELVTRDNRFSYAFASFADTRWPVRILSYRHGLLTVKTTAYPNEIKRDTTALWREAMARRRTRSNPGCVAAWAADQCLLGRSAQAFRTIDRLSRTRRIHGERTRLQFERRLRSFLRRTGYL
jgi:hypothetical protein